MPNHYLYRHIRPDLNIPFYIGIGTKYSGEKSVIKREYLRAYTFLNKTPYWKSIFSKNNGKIEIEILYESDSYDEIKNKEKEFISLYGRRDQGNGPLVNLTDGGEDNGRSVLTRQKMSVAHKGRKHTEEARHTMSIAQKGRKRTSIQIEKHRLKMIGRKQSAEAKANQIKAQKGRIVSEETRNKIKAGNTGKKRSAEVIFKMASRVVSDETRIKMSNAKKGKKLSPETIAKLVKIKTGKKMPPFSEDHKRKIGLASLGRIISTETRKKISLAGKGRKHSPESIAKMVQAKLKYWANKKLN